MSASLPFTVRGTVIDQAGALLAGVAVTLIEGTGSLWLPATTGDGGAFSFTQDPGVYTGGYTLFAKLAGHVDAQRDIPAIVNGATLEEHLTLPALGILTGLITDADAAVALAGAQVSVGTVRATSDANGRYEMQVAPGPVSIEVAAAAFEFGSMAATVVSAGKVEQDIALVRASATLTGTVFDANTGVGIRDALVRAAGAAMARPSADGVYTISRVPAGQVQIVASAEGYSTETVSVQIVAHETQSVNIYLGTGRPNPHPPAATK